MKKRKILLDKLQAQFEQDLKDGIPGYDCGETEPVDDAIEVLHRIVAVAIKTGRRQVFKYVNDHDFELQHKRAERSIHEDRNHKQLIKQLAEFGTLLRKGHV